GRIYEHIHLRDDLEKEIELPFLEIDEELWDPAMTRLTLFIDPGRIKRGVLPLEEIGPALEAGKSYSLIIDADWKDGAGKSLQAAFEKRFRVVASDREPPDPARWQIQEPGAGTREPLQVAFSEPMDQALAQRVIRVVSDLGKEVLGNVTLEDQEQRWVFVPNNAWRSGKYHVVVPTTVEDLAGNNIGKPFEVDLFEGVQKRLTTPTVKLPFEVR
ncbi:MAG TPA: Ig-like domain-containing protein, partial [Terriglobia bacterium]|nr:Ig-like domain-containing protein [Terriglobia bacterium]